ncbi:hypothetical protein L2E82_14305 [Cichorium intybus]|uniref:Uncharacterized protein n=1 Tax=Cichorium intybus TaxID=13427 RepID=A0ACB9F0F6_CICIN|nr:hypothetical protein L2E82_14305 [Cichorium intybus]
MSAMQIAMNGGKKVKATMRITQLQKNSDCSRDDEDNGIKDGGEDEEVGVSDTYQKEGDKEREYEESIHLDNRAGIEVKNTAVEGVEVFETNDNCIREVGVLGSDNADNACNVEGMPIGGPESDGLDNSIGLPDLNNLLPVTEPAKRNLGNKSGGRKQMSVNFKDLIKSTHNGRMKSKKATKQTREKSCISGNSETSIDCQSSSSEEIGKTLQVGTSIGYQFHGEERVVNSILEGEGVQIGSK